MLPIRNMCILIFVFSVIISINFDCTAEWRKLILNENILILETMFEFFFY